MIFLAPIDQKADAFKPPTKRGGFGPYELSCHLPGPSLSRPFPTPFCAMDVNAFVDDQLLWHTSGELECNCGWDQIGFQEESSTGSSR